MSSLGPSAVPSLVRSVTDLVREVGKTSEDVAVSVAVCDYRADSSNRVLAVGGSRVLATAALLAGLACARWLTRLAELVDLS
jgi:hypothetical protein